MFTYATWYLLTDISNYLSANIPFLYVEKPIIFTGILKMISIDLMLNMFLLLIIEFVIICLFHKRLNKLFKIDKLFTLKKFFVLAIVILTLQFILSFWMWYNDDGPVYHFEPVEDVATQNSLDNVDKISTDAMVTLTWDNLFNKVSQIGAYNV
jgi:hypothetical protein